MRVYGKEGRKPDLVPVVEANDLAKLKEKILVGIGTVRTLLYVSRNLSTAQNPPAFVGKMAAVRQFGNFRSLSMCAISFFIGRTNVS